MLNVDSARRYCAYMYFQVAGTKRCNAPRALQRGVARGLVESTLDGVAAGGAGRVHKP